MNRFLRKPLLNPAFKIVQPLPRLNPDWAKNFRPACADRPELQLASKASLALVLVRQATALATHGKPMTCTIRCTPSI
jgi:hypothetical protein